MAKLMRLVIVILLLGMMSVSAVVMAEEATSCDPAKAAMQLGSAWRSLTSGGIERSYLLYIPPAYDPAQRTPLVLSLHGFTSNGKDQERITGWNAIADTENFIVVYPQGTGTPTRWYAGQSRFIGREAVDDVQFFRDLLDELEKNLCVDTRRIYVNGMSNGGGMSNRLGCELADRIAAIGGVAGAYSFVPGGCNPVRPLPVIAFHGNTDPVVDYKGSRLEGFPPIEDWTQEWAQRNNCDLTPQTIPATGDASGIRYTNCEANADVILYTIDNGGHTWPGGVDFPFNFLGKTSHDINASAVMWEFFKAHPLPGTSS